MSVAKRALSALGKLGIIITVGVAFFIGMVGTVYLSLRSPEVQVPNVVGKDVIEGENALDKEGLNMRRWATRYSPEAKPNTILDQSPHPGEIIKVGQTVAVVISRANAKEGESAASTSAEENFVSEDRNTNADFTSAKNENDNRERSNRNTRNRNTNNSNNSNDNNANNSNANRNANRRNANDRNANDRNANDRNSNDRNSNDRNSNDRDGINRNANNRNANVNRPVNANRNVNSVDRNSNGNSNRGTRNSNANRRAPVFTTPPFIPNGNRP